MAQQAITTRAPAVVLVDRRRTEPLEVLLYWRSFAQRKWWILGFSSLVAAIAWGTLQFVTPVYRATVTLVIEQARARVLSIEDVYSGVSPNREHYQTQTEMLKSPALATRVVEKLGLLTHPELDPRQAKRSTLQVFWPSPVSPDKAWSEEEAREAVISAFLRRITIVPVRQTQLVKVSFDSADPELAARVANAIADSYIEADIEVRSRIRQQATDWLSGRLTDLKKNLESSERSLQQYREREGLLDTRGLAQSGAVSELEHLRRAANEARDRRQIAEANHKQLQAAGDRAVSSPVVLRNPLIERMREAERLAERQLAELTVRYGPEERRVAEAEARLRSARENTRRAVEGIVASHAREFQVASAAERASEKALAAAKTSIQSINRKEFQLDALEQDRTTNRQVYERFMNRYRETRAASDIEGGVVARVTDPAVRPRIAYKPRQGPIIGAAFVLGLLLAALVAVLLERLNNTVKSADDVEEKLGLPALAVIPLVKDAAGDRTGRYYLDRPNSVYAEAIRTARTSILLSAIDAPVKVLLVTSALPGEGKTAFALNLALAHAQTKKTLFIEADLRQPAAALQLGLDPTKPGLSSLFAKGTNFTECVQRPEGSSLYVLPAGPPAEHPLELLSSARFREMIVRAAAACEIVVIDSPPAHLVSDAAVLSTIATGVVVVVKADSTPYAIVRRTVKTLQAAGAPIIGVALNQLDFSKAGRYYGAYTGYAKEHGAYYGKPA